MIAALPIQQEKRELWTRLNGLNAVKPLLWMNERPWVELGIYEECGCEDEFAAFIEKKLRKEIYQWEHMPLDNVVENWIECPMAVSDTGFGLQEKSKKLHAKAGPIFSHGYISQINGPEDIGKIKDPIVTHNNGLTQARFEALNNTLGDIIPVKKRGVPHLWFAPWDLLISWWDVERVMLEMLQRPQMVHDLVSRLVSAYLIRLEQYRELNVLSLNNDNHRVGSGGYGYCDELPAKNFDGLHIHPSDLWGNGTAQIFSEVSPDMHLEFALQHEIKWMERFGLNYYGCCEPLHKKIEVLEKIPNLRKISISPWSDLEIAAAKIGRKYIISYKPNPAIFATAMWDPNLAKKELKAALEKMQGCCIEVIVKDISTVQHDPRRLWEWSKMAAAVTEEYAGKYC